MAKLKRPVRNPGAKQPVVKEPLKSKAAASDSKGKDSKSIKKDDNFVARAQAKALANAELEEEAQSKAEKDRTKNLKNVSLNLQTDSGNQLLKNESATIWVKPSDIEDHPDNASIYGQTVSEGLRQSIIEYGVVEDLVVCKGKKKPYRALSGHSRKRVMSDPDVINEIQKTDPSRSILVPIKFVGELGKYEQERLLLEFNVYRNKTYLQRMHEALREEDLVKREAKDRMKSGVGGHKNSGRTDEFLAKKYFGKSKGWFNTAKEVYQSLSVKHKNNYQKMNEDVIVKKIDNDEIKIGAANRSLKSHEPPREKVRIDKSLNDHDYAGFIKRFAKKNYDLDTCTNEELPMAYKYFSSLAREAKQRFEKSS